MKINPAEQAFEEMLPYFATIDAQIGAVVQLLKDKGMTTNEGLPALPSGAPNNWQREFRTQAIRQHGRIDHGCKHWHLLGDTSKAVPSCEILDSGILEAVNGSRKDKNSITVDKESNLCGAKGRRGTPQALLLVPTRWTTLRTQDSKRPAFDHTEASSRPPNQAVEAIPIQAGYSESQRSCG